MTKSFRAIRFHEYGSSDRLLTDTIDCPLLKPNEVLVEVHYAGVNPIDWKIRSGYLKDYMPVELPFIPGIDFSGVVTELGAKVKNLKKGQAVFGIANGTYAEYAVATAGDIVLKPENLSFELAATVPVGALTAWKAVLDAKIQKGQTVVVQGAAGGVGIFAVQFAKLKGAKVIGIASAANLDFVKSLAADQVLDYKKGLTDIKEIDAVIDLVGGEALDKTYQILRKGGTLVTIAGQVSEKKAAEYGIKVLGSGRGSIDLLKKIADLISKKAIHSEAGQVFSFSNAKDAQDLSQTGHGRGRILLKVK